MLMADKLKLFFARDYAKNSFNHGTNNQPLFAHRTFSDFTAIAYPIITQSTLIWDKLRYMELNFG